MGTAEKRNHRNKTINNKFKIMKFKVKKIKRIIKVDIQGNIIDESIHFVVYRSYLFGLVRAFIRVTPRDAWDIASEVATTYYHNYWEATEFDKQEDAEMLIQKMLETPSKFVIDKR